MSWGRCAIHPARPAFDNCPVCSRPRCHVDAEAIGAAGCLACTQPRTERPAAAGGELAVRAGLAGLAVAYLGGWIATQYVRVHLMSLVAPAVVGLAAYWAVFKAAGRWRPAPMPWVVAAAAALFGTALGFVLTPGGMNPLRDWVVVGGPYAAALVGVGLGPFVTGTGRWGGRRRGDQPPGEGDGEAVATDL